MSRVSRSGVGLEPIPPFILALLLTHLSLDVLPGIQACYKHSSSSSTPPSLNPQPEPLHPTPYTLHPTPSAHLLKPQPYTLPPGIKPSTPRVNLNPKCLPCPAAPTSPPSLARGAMLHSASVRRSLVAAARARALQEIGLLLVVYRACACVCRDFCWCVQGVGCRVFGVGCRMWGAGCRV